MTSKVIVAITLVVGVSVFAVSAAQSASASFSFSVDATHGVFGDPGATAMLGTHAVDASLLGRGCQVTIDVHNNDSVREGTDLLVASNGVTLTAANVEHRAGDAAPVTIGNLVLSDTVSISVRFGPEGSASVGATILVDCPDVPTTTLAPTSTLAPTTTLAPDVVVSPISAETPTAPFIAAVVVAQPRFTG